MSLGAGVLSEAIDDYVIDADGDDLDEALGLIDRLHAKVAATAVEFASSRSYEVEGHATLASFLRARCSMTTTEARRVAVRTKKLGRWPQVLDAWQTGVLRGAQVDVMATKVPDRHIDRFAAYATESVEVLSALSVDNTRTVLTTWVSAADDAAQTEAAETGIEPDPVIPVREMSASRILDDRLEITGSFDIDTAVRIETALVAATRPDTDDESRSPLQRRADAMVEICRFYLAHHQQPPGAGRPDRAVIVADITTLFRAILRGDGIHTTTQLHTYLAAQPGLGPFERGLFHDALNGNGGTAHTLDGHPVTDLLLRHVAQHGIVERLLRVGSRIIDHGRSTRIFTDSQRRAMAARDSGSRISGQPPWNCHAHHSPPFEHGGTTNVNNGYLKTTREHLKHHRDGWTDHIHPDGTIDLIDPHGNHHPTRPPKWANNLPTLPLHTTADPPPDQPFLPGVETDQHRHEGHGGQPEVPPGDPERLVHRVSGTPLRLHRFTVDELRTRRGRARLRALHLAVHRHRGPDLHFGDTAVTIGPVSGFLDTD